MEFIDIGFPGIPRPCKKYVHKVPKKADIDHAKLIGELEKALGIKLSGNIIEGAVVMADDGKELRVELYVFDFDEEPGQEHPETVLKRYVGEIDPETFKRIISEVLG